jgi:hypothetical protein
VYAPVYAPDNCTYLSVEKGAKFKLEPSAVHLLDTGQV